MRGLWATLCSWPRASLVLLTLACLLPFSGKPVHMDDPLFIWAAQQIVHHPLDPYGFTLTWYTVPMPMSEVTQNPPLASYYLALAGSVAGWSERALHLAFLLPAIAVVLGTYRLARNPGFEERETLRQAQGRLWGTHRSVFFAWLAAAATLVAPGFLVSATGLMCDVTMLALWLWAIVLWVEGLDEPQRPLYLAASGLLIAACALTKYFGLCLIPLLIAYSLYRRKRAGAWLAYFLIPVVLLAGYEYWTDALYGHGLIWGAFHYKTAVTQLTTRSGRALVGLIFAGGCTLPALTFAPLLWSRRQVIYGELLAVVLAACFYFGWIPMGPIYDYQRWLHQHKLVIAGQALLYLAGAICLIALAVADLRRRRDAASLLLFLWIAGTLVFAAGMNWTINARSLLPLVPAAGILIARRLDELRLPTTRAQSCAIATCLIVSAAVSLWAAAADLALAQTARAAAQFVQQKTRGDVTTTWFQGHWGFQYYMQSFGARPLDVDATGVRFGDLVVIPVYNTSLFLFPLKTAAPEQTDFAVHTGVVTMNPDAGAGFYFSGWGPLPFAFGPMPLQRYLMARAVQARE